MIFFISSFAFASCLNFISPVEAQKAINKVPNAGAEKCDPSKQKCICFDGIDFEVAELVDGKLQVSKDKVAQKKAEEDAKKTSEQQKKALVSSLKAKAKAGDLTEQEQKQVIKLLLEQLK